MLKGKLLILLWCCWSPEKGRSGHKILSFPKTALCPSKWRLGPEESCVPVKFTAWWSMWPLFCLSLHLHLCSGIRWSLSLLLPSLYRRSCGHEMFSNHKRKLTAFFKRVGTTSQWTYPASLRCPHRQGDWILKCRHEPCSVNIKMAADNACLQKPLYCMI